ncbi:MAG: AMP-binding protein [Nocardiopsaceae bacterium]|nr:AMP-binding protein [Nocardiopsaceae bacterium]
MLECLESLRDGPPGRGLYLYEKFDEPPEFTDYRDLAGHVAGTAGFFRAHGIGPGTRVLFPFETSVPAVFSFLALMEIGAVPLSVKPLLSSTPRASYEEFLAKVAREHHADRVLDLPGLGAAEVPVPRLPPPPAGIRDEAARLRIPAGEEIAFVQFSSGSTSFPKGIPVRHDKLKLNLSMIIRTAERRPEDRLSSWLPLYHDMGLVGGLLSCLAAGNDVLLATPGTFLFDVPGWWEHLAREKATITVIPNFAVDYSLRLLRGADPGEIAALDLSRVRSIYLGSEPINIVNLEAFTDLMASAGLPATAFMPCYGMAEAVLIVSTRPPGRRPRIVPAPSGVPAISVGRPMPEFTVRLRDGSGRECAEGELGEIELSGGSLALSYLGDPPGARLRADDGFYRTGDIGFRDDGELFITGRISDRIKVNGQSLFAADFEQALDRLPFVRDGRTAVVQSGDSIVVLTEVDRSARADIGGSRERIVEHLMHSVGVTVRAADVHFVRPGQLERTSSGKLRRRAIAQAYELGRLRGPTFDNQLSATSAR